jgi:hypothetical protein
MTDNAQELCRRFQRGEALNLRIADEADLSGFPVEANDCHMNVARWVSVNAGHIHVQGWLVTESCGGYIFDKHSVVGIGATLLDITPRSDQFVRQFLLYEGAPEEFERRQAQVIGFSN